jgi:hypothetical protein
VLGADDTGESSLAYTWSVTGGPAGAPSPTFSANCTNAAKNTTATFYQAGSYTILVTITDPGGLTATSSTTVTVNQTLTSIAVSPAAPTVPDGGSQQFTATALDQFGKALATQPGFSWSLAAGSLGLLQSTGMYAAPLSGSGSATVRAAAAGMMGYATVAVAATPAAPTSLTATAASPTQVNLAWSESSTGVNGFTIQRSSNGGKSWSTIAQVAGTVLTYADKSVSKGKTYQYRIAAFNGAGTSAWSIVAKVTTPLLLPLPYPDPDVPDPIPLDPGARVPETARPALASSTSDPSHAATAHSLMNTLTAASHDGNSPEALTDGFSVIDSGMALV